MTNAVSTQGVIFGVTGPFGAGGAEVTKYFNDVQSVPEMGSSPEKIEVTHLKSTNKEYIRGIPDFSSDLEFQMLANPAGASDSNLDFILTLIPTQKYKWTVIYPALKRKVEIVGEWTWKMGAAAVNAAQTLTLSVIPQGSPAWSVFSGTFAMSYDAHGGTGSMADPSSPYSAGATVTVLANGFTPPTGKTFSGWNTKADGTGLPYVAGSTFTIVEDTTLYAQWTD